MKKITKEKLAILSCILASLIYLITLFVVAAEMGYAARRGDEYIEYVHSLTLIVILELVAMFLINNHDNAFDYPVKWKIRALYWIALAIYVAPAIYAVWWLFNNHQ